MRTRPPSVIPNENRYDKTTVALHWLTATLVIALWALAQGEDLVPKPDRHLLWSIHIALGAGLLAALVVRTAWRTGRGVRLPPADDGTLGTVSKVVRGALYALLAAAVTLGIANTLARGWDFGGVIVIPPLVPDDRALRRAINGWHELAANATLVTAALHAAAALFHHYVLRDGVLRRMSVARSR